jgi:hypothetical protein
MANENEFSGHASISVIHERRFYSTGRCEAALLKSAVEHTLTS